MIAMNLTEKHDNKRILIVDDEIDVLDFLQLFLSSLGWDVVAAPTITEAFKALDEQSFFLVITDIAMPNMDGHEFISTLHDKHIPSEIALMTGFGYNPNHTLVKIYKTVRYPCLFKPFNRAKVTETVQDAWNRYHGAGSTTQSVIPA